MAWGRHFHIFFSQWPFFSTFFYRGSNQAIDIAVVPSGHGSASLLLLLPIYVGGASKSPVGTIPISGASMTLAELRVAIDGQLEGDVPDASRYKFVCGGAPVNLKQETRYNVAMLSDRAVLEPLLRKGTGTCLKW